MHFQVRYLGGWVCVERLDLHFGIGIFLAFSKRQRSFASHCVIGYRFHLDNTIVAAWFITCLPKQAGKVSVLSVRFSVACGALVVALPPFERHHSRGIMAPFGVLGSKAWGYLGNRVIAEFHCLSYIGRSEPRRTAFQAVRFDAQKQPK